MAGPATTVAPWISALRAEASTRKKHVLTVINGKLSRANIKQLTKADRHHLQELYDEIDLGPRPGQPTISAARARKYKLPAGISILEVPLPAAPPPRVEAASASTRAAAPLNIHHNPPAPPVPPPQLADVVDRHLGRCTDYEFDQAYDFFRTPIVSSR